MNQVVGQERIHYDLESSGTKINWLSAKYFI